MTSTSATSIVVRPACTDDAGEYLQLVDALARYERSPPPDAQARTRLIDHLFGSKPLYRLLVAEDPATGHLVGYAAWFLTYSTFVARPTFYLEDLFVLAEYRRAKVGRKLLKFCAKTALVHGCGRMDFVVLDWNDPALDFYKKFGVDVEKEWLLHRADEAAIKALSED